MLDKSLVHFLWDTNSNVCTHTDIFRLISAGFYILQMIKSLTCTSRTRGTARRSTLSCRLCAAFWRTSWDTLCVSSTGTVCREEVSKKKNTVTKRGKLHTAFIHPSLHSFLHSYHWLYIKMDKQICGIHTEHTDYLESLIDLRLFHSCLFTQRWDLLGIFSEANFFKPCTFILKTMFFVVFKSHATWVKICVWLFKPLPLKWDVLWLLCSTSMESLCYFGEVSSDMGWSH